MESLGLDLKIFIAQIVNFGLLLFILNKLIYKPLLKMIDKRNKKIDSAVKNSELLETKLEEIEEKQKTLLAKAKKEAEKDRKLILEMAEKEKTEIVKKAKISAKKEVEKGLVQLKSEKAKIAKEISRDYIDGITDDLYKKLSGYSKDKNYPLLTKVLKS